MRSGFIGATAVVAVLTVAQKVTGFVREQALAAAFGATPVADAFLIGTVWSDMAGFVVASVLVTALVPAFIHASEGGGTRTLRQAVFSSALRTLVVGSGLALVLGFLAPAWLSPMVGEWSPELQEIAVKSARISLYQLPLFGLAAVYRAALNAHGEHFYGPTGVIVQNIVNAGFVWLVGASDPVELSLLQLIGFSLPAVVAMVPYYCMLFPKTDNSVRLSSYPGDQYTEKSRLRLLPLVLWSITGYAYVLIERLSVASLEPGSIALLTYADRLRQFAVQAVVLGIVTVVYPELARTASVGDGAKFHSLFTRGLRLALLGALPAAVGLLALRGPIVEVVFQRGAFSAAATAGTARVLLGYSLGIPFLVVGGFFAHVLFALQKPWGPALAALLGVGAHMLAAFALGTMLGPLGLGVAASIGAAVTVVIQMALLLWERPDLFACGPRAWLRSFLTYAIPNVALLLVCNLMVPVVLADNSGLGLIAGVAVIVLVGALLYIVLLWSLGLPEVRNMSMKLVGKRTPFHPME